MRDRLGAPPDEVVGGWVDDEKMEEEGKRQVFR
jgi:hypothetical protein